jgi:hypothetical protein
MAHTTTVTIAFTLHCTSSFILPQMDEYETWQLMQHAAQAKRPSTAAPNIHSYLPIHKLFNNHSTTITMQSTTLYGHMEKTKNLSYFSIPSWHCLEGLRKFTKESAMTANQSPD